VVERLSVGAYGGGLIGVSGAGADDPGLGRGEPLLRHFAEGGGGGRAQRAVAERDLALLPPGPSLAQ
jgi:hypothetical protein